jgi:hypothetical protein
VTYTFEFLMVAYMEGLELTINGEEIDYYQATDPSYPDTPTCMGMVSLPGSRDQRHIMELHHGGNWRVNWHWLTMYSV